MGISNFPAELLSDTFLIHVRAEQRQLESDSMIIPQWKDIYSPLYVCKQWNNVMMHYPLLWDFVSMSSSVECISAMLERSKGVPLQVQPTGPERHSQIYNEQGLRLVLEQSHRIQHLMIYVTDEVARVISSCFCPPIPLPMIRSLSVSNETTGSVTNTIPSQAQAIFPFEPSTSLQIVNISGYSITQLKRAMRPALQSVSLLPSEAMHQHGSASERMKNEYVDDEPKSSLYKTLEYLAQMSHLQDIRIRHWFPNETWKQPLGRIVFNHLRSLSVYLRSAEADFLKYLLCPPGLRLHLTVHCRTFRDNIMSTLLKDSSEACGFWGHDKTREMIRALEVCHTVEGFSTLKCWTTVVPSLDLKNDGPKAMPHLQIDFDRCETMNASAVCSAVTNSLPLEELDSLTLSFPTKYFSGRDISTLRSAFQTIKTTKVLVVRNWRECEVCGFLFNPRVIFPLLQELRAVTLCRLPEKNVMFRYDFPNISVLEEERRAFGMPIKISVIE